MTTDRMVWPWETTLAKLSAPLRVAGSTQAPTLATAILRFLDEGRIVYLECIAPVTVHIAMKAVAIANGEAGQQGKVLVVMPAFDKKSLPDRHGPGNVDITALRFMVSRAPVLMWFNDGDSHGQEESR